ncbi:hypothetical protein [Breznakia pachnodae]|uniref:Uncharacterized protein n=1 Tax=Breznakia pachnodae TaxID=265178 RepID=A0ABU0E8U8_9FIRM|nr:hypothetical protein [Breznakia pachnodae]MDQ0363310.1 hypothetical protein [Breznakia pachnodae]
MKKFIKYTIIIMMFFPIIVLGVFTYFSLFQNDPNRSIAITRSDWMLMWGAILSYVSTVALGIVALYQSNQANTSANTANQMTQHLIEMEHRERLAFVGVESTKPLLIYHNNSHNKSIVCFENEMNSTKTWINAEFRNNSSNEFDYYQEDDDYSLLIFNIKALSSNYVKKIKVNSISITSSIDDIVFRSKKIWTDCGQFLEFGNSYKVALIIHGLAYILKQNNLTIQDGLFPKFELFINVTVENLYGDKVMIYWSMSAEEGELIEKSMNEINNYILYQYQIENIGFQVQEKSMSTILSSN